MSSHIFIFMRCMQTRNDLLTTIHAQSAKMRTKRTMLLNWRKKVPVPNPITSSKDTKLLDRLWLNIEFKLRWSYVKPVEGHGHHPISSWTNSYLCTSQTIMKSSHPLTKLSSVSNRHRAKNK